MMEGVSALPAIIPGMLASVASAAILGIDAYRVTVEVDVAPGLPQWTVVGLAAGAVREARERVAAAIVNSGFALPSRRVTVNLAPADMRKEGTAFDLPIALGLLSVATGQVEATTLTAIGAVGELALDGTIPAGSSRRPPPSPGPLLLADHRPWLVPGANVSEAALVRGVALGAPANLRAAVDQLQRRSFVIPPATAPARPVTDESGPDLSDVIGQAAGRRALEIAAAGDHGMVLVGPPGSGKTLLARCMPRVLPALTEDEALEVIAVHSVAGLMAPDRVASPARPFRAPHHTVSAAGLVGGGNGPRPGEVSLAHRGVLFLDEMLEFPRHTLDAMRQPLEDGSVTIVRATGRVRFPAQFTLFGAMNLCPCRLRRRPVPGRCVNVGALTSSWYRSRLTRPMTDRIDLHVAVAAVPVRSLGTLSTAESSANVRTRVEFARAIQRKRYARLGPLVCNGRVPGRWLDRETIIEPAARELLASAAERLGLSARSYHRVLRVARTIADLDGVGPIQASAVGEALRYRAGNELNASHPFLSVATHVSSGRSRVDPRKDEHNVAKHGVPCEFAARAFRRTHAAVA